MKTRNPKAKGPVGMYQPMTDPWDDLYIYLHFFIYFYGFHVGKYTVHGSYGTCWMVVKPGGKKPGIFTQTQLIRSLHQPGKLAGWNYGIVTVSKLWPYNDGIFIPTGQRQICSINRIIPPRFFGNNLSRLNQRWDPPVNYVWLCRGLGFEIPWFLGLYVIYIFRVFGFHLFEKKKHMRKSKCIISPSNGGWKKNKYIYIYLLKPPSILKHMSHPPYNQKQAP